MYVKFSLCGMFAGLLRCGKSCRLRWMNYLRPDIKRGNISSDEEDLIIRLHSLLSNRWSLIAKRLPGRTDNEIKNYWNSHLSKRVETSKVTQTKAARAVKKKHQPTNGKKQKRNYKDKKDKKDNTTSNEEITTTKIYLPKAVRVSPYSLGFHQTNPYARWPDLLKEEANNNSEVGGTCSNGDQLEHSLDNSGSDFSFLDFEPIEGNMLDDIIGQYQQLLNFDEKRPTRILRGFPFCLVPDL